MQDYTKFLDAFFEQIEKAGIAITGLSLDHIAYQASSSDDYDDHILVFEKIGKEVSEEIIGDRRVTVFKLKKPIHYKSYVIPALELIEPKEKQICESGYQHAEFVLTMPFEDYKKLYPKIRWDTSSMNRGNFAHLKLNFENGLTLKFLKKPILELVSPR